MADRSQIAAVLATMEGVFAAMAMVVDAGDLEHVADAVSGGAAVELGRTASPLMRCVPTMS